MASTITLESLAAKFEQLEAENALLKAAVAAAPAKAAKVTKVKTGKTTNPTGPTAFNVLVRAAWIDMAGELGVFMDEYDEDDEAAKDAAEKKFKKEAGAAGAGYQAAMKEASKRKAELEGKEYKGPNVKEPKVKAEKKPKDVVSAAEKLRQLKEQVAAAKAAKAAAAAAQATPVVKAPAPKPKAKAAKPTLSAEQLAAAEELGWVERVFDGVTRWFDPLDNCVYVYDGEMEQVGEWDEAARNLIECE